MDTGEKFQGWEYSDHPLSNTVEEACSFLVDRIKKDSSESTKVLKETRPFHRTMFENVTPPSMDYFAGNYRGAHFPLLDTYEVSIAGFPGTQSSIVHLVMDKFHTELHKNLSSLSNFFKDKNFSEEKKLIAFSSLVSVFFVNFLAIHPFANGNGHISRLLVFCIFKSKSIRCSFWKVPNRNIEPPDCLIAEYRNGNKSPLVVSFLRLIASENSASDFNHASGAEN